MNTVEIKLLKYAFRFRTLTWREEFKIKYDPKKDRLRTMLAHALEEVSGLKVKSAEEATKVLDALPQSVVNRVFILFKGETPEPRLFTTTGLYKAPEPSRFVKKVEEIEEKRERVMDKVEAELEQKFGRKELDETIEVERLMAKNSKLRGVTKPSPDRHNR
jgi:hypothetical protein